MSSLVGELNVFGIIDSQNIFEAIIFNVLGSNMYANSVTAHPAC